MRINLLLKSYEQGNEVGIKVLPAIKKITNNSVLYKYIDEFSKTSIEIFKNFVIIEREGNIKSKMVLKEGILTEFNYSSKYMNTIFQLFTKKMKFLTNGLEISYIISQNDNFINEINFSIIEK